MEFELLKSLQVVAQEGNLTSAAGKLCVTQPTLTRRLNKLEEECGKKLLERGNRETVLTEEGELMLHYVERIMALYDRMEHDIFNYNDIISGELVIGSVNTEAIALIAQAVSSVHRKYPNVRFHIRAMAANELNRGLRDGLIDFGVQYDLVDTSICDYVRLPFKNKWGLAMPKDDPLAKKKTISASDIINLPLICPERELPREVLNGWTGLDSDTLNVIITYYLSNHVSAFVRAGIGYAVVMDSINEMLGAYDLVYRPFRPVLSTYVHVSWNKHLEMPALSKVFLRELRFIIEGVHASGEDAGDI